MLQPELQPLPGSGSFEVSRVRQNRAFKNLLPKITSSRDQVIDTRPTAAPS